VYFAGKFHGDWPLAMWIAVGVIALIAGTAAVVIGRR